MPIPESTFIFPARLTMPDACFLNKCHICTRPAGPAADSRQVCLKWKPAGYRASQLPDRLKGALIVNQMLKSLKGIYPFQGVYLFMDRS